MNPAPSGERFVPHPNFDNAINRAILASEIDGGLALDDVEVGAVLEVETGHTRYRLENVGGGKVLISGHPQYCPQPVLVTLLGSTWGGPMLKMRFIGRGMKMQFEHPVLGVITTSRVREIRDLARGVPQCVIA